MDDATNKRIMPRFITDKEVKTVISWPLVMEAVVQALRAACRAVRTKYLPSSNQPPRSYTSIEGEKVMLMTMPGYVANYELSGHVRSTLACKFVMPFNEDETPQTPLPSMQASILLFNTSTGRIKCIMEGNEINTMTIAAASIIASKYIYFYKPDVQEQGDDWYWFVLSIVGCGVQGRIHAMGFVNCFISLTEIRLWDNTFSEAESLAKELEELGEEYNIKITISQTVDDCVFGADVIVLATIGSEPLLQSNMIKSTAHINVIEDGVNQYCGLSEELYLNSNVYIDNWGSARTELKEGPQVEIVGLLGEVLDGLKPINTGITVFQSMGMAANDAIVAEAVYDLIK